MIFSKCTYCDKLHLCTNHDREDWILPQNKINEMVTQAIIPLIPEDLRLRELFLKWSSLKHNIRAAIDEKIDLANMNLYLPLKHAFKHWEILQETEGAPGFDSGVFSFSCDAHLEGELVRVITKFEDTLGSVVSDIMCTKTQYEPNMLHISSDELLASEFKGSLRILPRFLQKSASMGNLLMY